MSIPDLVLHPSANQQLDTFLQNPSHAVLLSGPMGIGKTSIAAGLGAALLQLSPTQLDSAAYHKLVRPKGGTISIEQIRELITFFRLKVPGMKSTQRVAIIEDADTMGVEAQNALLKLLEEPPTDSVLILTSSAAGRLLATIRSRTTLLQLPAPTEKQLQEHFVAAGYDTSAVKAALLRASTNVAQATSLLDTNQTDQTDTLSIVKQALTSSQYERLLMIDSLVKQKEAAYAFVDALAVVAAASLESAANRGVSTERWQAILQASLVAQSAFERNGNAKLVLTELMLSL